MEVQRKGGQQHLESICLQEKSEGEQDTWMEEKEKESRKEQDEKNNGRQTHRRNVGNKMAKAKKGERNITQ